MIPIKVTMTTTAHKLHDLMAEVGALAAKYSAEDNGFRVSVTIERTNKPEPLECEGPSWSDFYGPDELAEESLRELLNQCADAHEAKGRDEALLEEARMRVGTIETLKGRP